MPQNFIRGDVDQGFLLPPDVRDWLPDGELAWTVKDAVDSFDLSGFKRSYRANGQGAAAFDPALMVAVLLYAHAVGVRSSRAIERHCVRDVAFRVLAGNRVPDHATIARFVTRHRQPLQELFAQVLRVCHEAGMVRLGVIAVDGTKIAANASWSKNHTSASLAHQVAEEQARYDQLAAELLDEQTRIDAAEDAEHGDDRGDELPPPLRRRAERLARLKEAKQRLDDEQAAAVAEQEVRKAEWQRRKDAGTRRGAQPGEHPPGRNPDKDKPPRANATDPDSRTMRGGRGLVQGYNAQAAVTEDQLIVGQTLTQAATDAHQLFPVLDDAAEQLNQAGIEETPDTWVADAGYANEETFTEAETRGLRLLAPMISDERRAAGEDPAGDKPLTSRPATARAQDRLRTPEGTEKYALRGRTVEPVFGQIKDRQGLRQLLRRGLQNAKTEWSLACTVHNLRKIHAHRLATA
ncbi:transposase [Blastococcus colisei]|uniref:Transposase n=1 Tax=Blastococcus colisei TaxID=1564162 RepID=A0A543NU52_9ACTN|nr:transposase [Blastococcus colisei]TQN35366.1 transposase [Blastococcus colisei]TQN37637.1 transposase [Blastococcus colisei]TQN37699.1 transposase [Blastococcus colisei]TQN37724.1 transposase [Blastococcus colisei]TQN37880.1 transposase [Blastococcus colisei]